MNKLSKWTKLAYGLGHVHNDIAATICFSFSLLYMQACNFKCFRHTVSRCRGGPGFLGSPSESGQGLCNIVYVGVIWDGPWL